MRILSIDYGKKRIGIAITDNSKTIAYPLTTLEGFSSLEQAANNLLEKLKDYLKETELILIGYPLHLDGKESKMSQEVSRFFKILETKIKIPIILSDERLTSEEAEAHLKNNLNLSRKKRSKKIDPIAATIILQDYLSQKTH